MLEFHILVIRSHHGGNLTSPTCELSERYLYILRGVLKDHLMEVLPLGGLMVLEGLEDFPLMVLMVLVVLGGLVASLLMVSEGLVALLLVVLEAPEAYRARGPGGSGGPPPGCSGGPNGPNPKNQPHAGGSFSGSSSQQPVY